jgi:excisionase family DNA binding protein
MSEILLGGVASSNGQAPLDDGELLTVEEVAALLKVAPSWVYLHTRRRKKVTLPHMKIGKYLRFCEADVRAFLERLKKE